MISLEDFTRIADEEAGLLPECFYEELNGGILVLEESKLHPKTRSGRPLYILGEYRRHPHLGKQIVLYYGSMTQVYYHLPEEEMREQIRKVLRHEFQHHMEYRSGLRDLEVEDEVNLHQYLSEME